MTCLTLWMKISPPKPRPGLYWQWQREDDGSPGTALRAAKETWLLSFRRRGNALPERGLVRERIPKSIFPTGLDRIDP